MTVPRSARQDSKGLKTGTGLEAGAQNPQRSGNVAKRSQRERNRALLFVLQGPQQGAVFAIQRNGLLLGRDRNVDANLTEDTISREHARLLATSAGIYIEDLGSHNGTFVNDERVLQPTRLLDGDYLRIGDSTIIKFCMTDELEERALRTLFELTLRDPLTRLYNRRYFDDRLRSEFAFARRHNTHLALLLLDIDHFKNVNDSYGHQAGDLVLKLVANDLGQITRPEDMLARYGGEEFIFVARGMALHRAQAFGERIRHRIEQRSLTVLGHTLHVTVSLGVTCMGPEMSCESPEALVAMADEALYQAKTSGRNRVCAVRSPDASGTYDAQPNTLPPSQKAI